MDAWIRQILEAPAFGASALPIAFLLGMASLLACASCNIPMMAAVVGYAGAQEPGGRRQAVVASAFFMVGISVALGVLGGLAAYVGQVAGGEMGRYGRALVGFLSVLFGLASLDLFPFRVPGLDLLKQRRRPGILGAAVFGLAVGAASITCTAACCGPALPAVLGLATLRGQPEWGVLILVAFALGYSLPMAAVVLGVGLGRLSGVAQRAAGPIRRVAGVALMGVGFWLLATV